MNLNFKFLLVLILTFKVVTAAGGVFDFLYKLSSTDQKYMLSAINGKRSLHESTEPVKWSEKLVTAAVNKLTKDFTCKKGISLSNDAYGYTYYFGTEGVGAAVESWYKGESSYNYNTPEISTANRDFIQLVWAQSTEIGCASRLCGSHTVYLCQYYQPGVYRDTLEWNVFPRIGSSRTETSLATTTLVQTDVATNTVISINTETHVVTNTDITTETQVSIQLQTETKKLTNTETLISTEVQTHTERLTSTNTVTHISVITAHHTITDTATLLTTVPTIVTQNLTVMQTQTETVTYDLIFTEVVTHYYNTTDVRNKSFTVTNDVTFLTTETVTLINSENNVVTITETKHENITNTAVTINPTNVTINETVTVTNDVTKTDTITSLGNYSYPEAITVTVTSIPDNVKNMTITVISTEGSVHNVTSTETIIKTTGEVITSFVTIVETKNAVSEVTTTTSITVKETVSLYITPSQLPSAHETVTMTIASTKTIRETVTVSNSFPSGSTSETSGMTATSESGTTSSSLSASAVITSKSGSSYAVFASSTIQSTGFSHSLLSSTLSSSNSKVFTSVDPESKIKTVAEAIEHNAIGTDTDSTNISEYNNNSRTLIEAASILLNLPHRNKATSSHMMMSDSNSLEAKGYTETHSSEKITEIFVGTSISTFPMATHTNGASINVNDKHEASNTTLGQTTEEGSLFLSQTEDQNVASQVTAIQGPSGQSSVGRGTSGPNSLDHISKGKEGSLNFGHGQGLFGQGTTVEGSSSQGSSDHEENSLSQSQGFIGQEESSGDQGASTGGSTDPSFIGLGTSTEVTSTEVTSTEATSTEATSTEVTFTEVTFAENLINRASIDQDISAENSNGQVTSIEGTSTVAGQDISTVGSTNQDHDGLSPSQSNTSTLEQNEKYPGTDKYENTLASTGNSLSMDQFQNEATQSSGLKGGKTTMFSSYDQAHTTFTSTLSKASNSGITNTIEAIPNMTQNINGNTASHTNGNDKDDYLSRDSANNRIHKENRVSVSDQLDHISLSSSGARETVPSVNFTAYATVADDSISSMDTSSASVVISGTSVIPRETGNWNARSSIEHGISDNLMESSSLNTISHSIALPSTVQIPPSDANKDASAGLTFSNSATSIHLKTWKSMMPILFLIFYFL